MAIAAAGTHPFSSWHTQEITQGDRYIGVKEDMGELAQRLLIFGTHIHIGIEDPEFMIDAMNVVRYMLPHLLCLSTSSPFWMGRNTGAQVVSQHDLPQLPAHRHPAHLRVLVGLHQPDRHDDPDELHPRPQQDLVGRAPAPRLPDAGGPHLRHLHPCR